MSANRQSRTRLPPSDYIPQCLPNQRPLMIWSSVAAGALLFVAMIIGAPVALAYGHGLVGQTIYQAFGHLCHQIPERSFFIAGHQFAVCARCTGLYMGFAAAVLFYPFVRSLKRTDTPPRKWLFVSAVPIALDFGLGLFGVWGNTHFSRFATGALLGAVAVFYVVPGLIELSLRGWQGFGRGGASKSQPLAFDPSYSDTPVQGPTDYPFPDRRV